MTNVEVCLAYLRAIEAREDFAALGARFHPDARVTEHPNKITPGGKVYDLAAIEAASARGRALLAREQYVVRSTIAEGERVVIESTWIGTLADGRELRAEICSVFVVRDEKIVAQAQYDCFY